MKYIFPEWEEDPSNTAHNTVMTLFSKRAIFMVMLFIAVLYLSLFVIVWSTKFFRTNNLFLSILGKIGITVLWLSYPYIIFSD